MNLPPLRDEVDFANILFSGSCNRSCPWCIGKQLPPERNANNLNIFPPKNVERLIELVNTHHICNVVFTGTTTDPQLYRHELRLLDYLRSKLHPRVRYSVHTNGVVALRKMSVFNAYDKACISFPSFNPEIYAKMMGTGRPPDLKRIVEHSRIEVKVSCVLDSWNVDTLDGFLEGCRKIGIQRVVLRRLFGEKREWNILERHSPSSWYRNNPVYDLDGMQVTYWNFDTTSCMSINLFPDGTLGMDYLLTGEPGTSLANPNPRSH